MKVELINLLLFSDKRKNFLLLLAEGPKSIDDILDLLQIQRVSLLPQIKKLKEQRLIVQEGDICSLSAIGNILIKKVQPLINAISVFEENEYFWSQRKLDTIPVPFLKRIEMLKCCQLIGPGIENWSDLFPESVKQFDKSAEVLLLFSYFHPSIPPLCLECAKKCVKLKLVLSRDSFEKFCKDFHSEGEKILAHENVIIFLRTEETLEMPVSVAVTESKLLLGLINKKGKFEGQYILSSESSALSWGKELFEYYMEGSRKVSSFTLLSD
jgi:predicted transcriptional regulator